ncbi:ATP-binding protein [Desulfococcus sp.]|uniref:ATP-binding protein n=1 Tax=Desulfococcus sp. TaxID=2025834 RepID=UPI003593CCB6
MKLIVYKELLSVMKSRRGPYAGLDIPQFFDLVEELFSPEEAGVNNALSKEPEMLEEIALKLHRDPKELRPLLEGMADKGLCATFVRGNDRVYKGLPFMPGIFEYQFISGRDTARYRKLAQLIYAYKKAFDAATGIEEITFPVTRVIPVNKTIDASNRIHTYDQVATYIQKYDAIGVGTCYCRHAAKLRGEDTHDMPMDVCMWFGHAADYMVDRIGGRKVTKAEAMDLLDRCETAGLIHMSRNTTEEIEFLCNCDRWHCEVVNQVLKQAKPGWIFNSGYQPRFNPGKCVACETCIDRCPPEALTMGYDHIPVVNLDRCFGCSVCATGCPEEAIVMESKPEFPSPPKNVKELVSALKAGRLYR